MDESTPARKAPVARRNHEPNIRTHLQPADVTSLAPSPLTMKNFHCDQCGQQVFFENTLCFNCNNMLGYDPVQKEINSFEPLPTGQWRSLNPDNQGRVFKQCANYAIAKVCNWMLDADHPDDLCKSCQLTLTIPDLSKDKNRLLWQRLEAAKRRLLYSLLSLNLQPESKHKNVANGLAFEFLEDGTAGEKVLTGHDEGLITLNIAEADAVQRERNRDQLGEQYRTLLGHFRHESGHYYFDRLIADEANAGNPEWLNAYRDLFGNEQADYGESLKHHYENGPRADWESYFVSAYASSHPWEDWAETWAHYLHMTDTLETAYACGLSLKPQRQTEPALEINRPPLKIDSFEEIINDWFALTYVLNSLNRSVGMPDPYPFKLPAPVYEKLHFVHRVILAQAEKSQPSVAYLAA